MVYFKLFQMFHVKHLKYNFSSRFSIISSLQHKVVHLFHVKHFSKLLQKNQIFTLTLAAIVVQYTLIFN